jgi:hypothetical protein
MFLNFDEPILYHVRSNGQKLLLKLIGFDDSGFQMESPLGGPIKTDFIGEIVTDPEGNRYRITKISFQNNMVWLEQYS